MAPNLGALLEDAVRRRVAESVALLVARDGRVVFRGAAGSARPDSIFDLASVTKVVATTTAVMQLIDRGKLRLDTRIGDHLGFLADDADKRGITVEQLLLHTSGLPPVVYRGELSDGRDKILERIRRARLRSRPGSRHRYSDIGFILLGELVRARTGLTLDAYAARHIFGPLGMCDTGFVPSVQLVASKRVISPWPGGEKPGQVYDPLGARLGGVAGHAGLYSTLDDLGRFGQALLTAGRSRGRRIVSAGTLSRFLRPRTVPGASSPRGLGWLVDVKPRPGQLSRRAFGHGGFTGTSLWVDPQQQLVIALLANRTFHEPARSISPLRRRVHALIRTSLLLPERPRAGVQTGLDQLVADDFRRLAGRRVGLITNRTAVDRRGRWIVDLVARHPRVELVALFAPEHGIEARVDRHVKDRTYVAEGGRRVPVYSLFGQRRRPDDRTLQGIDTLVFDVAAVGARYYTYLATMGWAMEEAARRRLRFVVLDRPNPIGGQAVQGPVASDGRRQTSTNYYPLPVRYGMTVGELAGMFRQQRRINCRLEVIGVKGWRRGELFAKQRLAWVDPSPNIRSWIQALLYAGIGLLEGTNLAVGRGTDSPFEWVGAPWIDGPRLAEVLNHTRLPGVYFVPDERTPRSSRYRGQRCAGVRPLVLDPVEFRPVRTGVAVALAVRALYPQWDPSRLYRMIRHPPTTRAILSTRSLQSTGPDGDAPRLGQEIGQRAEELERLWTPGLRRFERLRRRYLLYR